MRCSDRCLIMVIGLALFFGASSLGEAIWSQNTSPGPLIPYVVPYFAPPEQLALCGEPVPLDNPDVKERLDREFTIVVYSHAQVYLWLKRMQRYFPWLEKELVRNGLPDDLKYVAVAESDLQVSASSPAGAVGPWQFIRSTGANYGLAQSEGIDERRDFERSTQCAFKYLRDLRELFPNWALAIAGYNCGERRVQDEVKRQKVNSYYLLKLPLETERYLFRILAIKEVLSHPEKYGYYLPEGAGYPGIATERVNVVTPCALPVQTVAELAGITYRDFKNLNPALISDTLPEGSHTVKVPGEKGKEFCSRFETFKAGYQPKPVLHKVGKGETLSSIAAHYGVSTARLQEWNGLQGDKVRLGQVLKIIR
jgi:membrane-bound lytic murein transglycosylase D